LGSPPGGSSASQASPTTASRPSREPSHLSEALRQQEERQFHQPHFQFATGHAHYPHPGIPPADRSVVLESRHPYAYPYECRSQQPQPQQQPEPQPQPQPPTAPVPPYVRQPTPPSRPSVVEIERRRINAASEYYRMRREESERQEQERMADLQRRQAALEAETQRRLQEGRRRRRELMLRHQHQQQAAEQELVQQPSSASDYPQGSVERNQLFSDQVHRQPSAPEPLLRQPQTPEQLPSPLQPVAVNTPVASGQDSPRTFLDLDASTYDTRWEAIQASADPLSGGSNPFRPYPKEVKQQNQPVPSPSSSTSSGYYQRDPGKHLNAPL